MSSVWFAIPSARPVEEADVCLQAWLNAGYNVAVFLNEGAPLPRSARLSLSGPYPGYAKAVNALVKEILRVDPKAEWIVTGGDDTWPDPNNRPDKIAFECGRYFGEKQDRFRAEKTLSTSHGWQEGRFHWSTFGVVQPTGDRFAGGSIDRIAGSPWIGREFCQRMYGGTGPYFEGYMHMFSDEEILCVAESLGVYWRRPDLIHLHRHFMRASDDLHSPAIQKDIPPHLVRWNSREHWDESQALFRTRRAQGFPGHQLIETRRFERDEMALIYRANPEEIGV